MNSPTMRTAGKRAVSTALAARKCAPVVRTSSTSPDHRRVGRLVFDGGIGTNTLRDPLIFPYYINKKEPFLNRRLALEECKAAYFELEYDYMHLHQDLPASSGRSGEMTS